MIALFPLELSPKSKQIGDSSIHPLSTKAMKFFKRKDSTVMRLLLVYSKFKMGWQSDIDA
jgi:hypothetical protein